MLSRILGFGRVVTIAALIGCGSSGGGGGGGGGSFTTSVPAGTKLTALTPAQETQLCNDFNGYETQAITPVLCKAIALTLAALSGGTTDADLRTACTQGYNSCLSGDGGFTTTSSCDSTTFSGEPSTCQATVGDLQKCANDETAASNQIYGSLPSCSTLTAASLASALSADAGAEPAEPASCSMFDAQCKGMSMSSGGTN